MFSAEDEDDVSHQTCDHIWRSLFHPVDVLNLSKVFRDQVLAGHRRSADAVVQNQRIDFLKLV